MNLSEKLVQLGFSPNQAIVYTALMELGQSKAAALIKKTGLHRNIVYEALDVLEKRRLIFKTSNGGVALFQLSDADSLVQDVELQLEIATTVASEVNVRRERSGHEVKIYEGVGGLKAHRNRVLHELEGSDDAFRVIAASKERDAEYEEYFRVFHKERVQRGVHEQILFPQNMPEQITELQSLDVTEARPLPQAINEPTMIDIWKDNVAFMIQEAEPFIISIKSPQLAKSFREYFDALWDQTDSSV